MKNLFFNDQAYIAEQFCLQDEHTLQTSRFATNKIHSYKLSLRREAYCMSQKELSSLLKSTLLNYTHPAVILSFLEYYAEGTNN